MLAYNEFAYKKTNDHCKLEDRFQKKDNKKDGKKGSKKGNKKAAKQHKSLFLNLSCNRSKTGLVLFVFRQI